MRTTSIFLAASRASYSSPACRADAMDAPAPVTKAVRMHSAIAVHDGANQARLREGLRVANDVSALGPVLV